MKKTKEGSRSRSSSSEHQEEQHQNSGMGFLLVFFPEEENITTPTPTTPTFINTTKKNPLSSPSSSSPNFLNRTYSTHLLSRAQSTISICALLIFITLLLFTLSTIEPSSSSSSHTSFSPRRHLLISSSNSHFKKYPSHIKPYYYYSSSILPQYALQGMGTLYRRGSKSMNDLVVAHIVESLSVNELRLFIRFFHSCSLAFRSDLLFLFPSKSSSFDSTILQENNSFLKFIESNSAGGFEGTRFVKWSKKKEKENGPEPIWGRGIRSNSSSELRNDTESTRLSYGSVVAFDVDELDPENSLDGFLDHVPMSLRRWACYPMLLGRVRNRFKHIMLVDAKEMLLFGDPLSRVRNTSPESVYLTATTHSPPNRHGKKNSDRTQSNHSKSVSPGIIAGGGRGVRRISNAMLTEIARTAIMQHKKKNSVTESALFNQLVSNEFLLKNVNLITSKESIPELSSLAGGLNSKLAASGGVIRRGYGNFDVNSTVVKHILCADSSLHNTSTDDC